MFHDTFNPWCIQIKQKKHILWLIADTEITYYIFDKGNTVFILVIIKQKYILDEITIFISHYSNNK